MVEDTTISADGGLCRWATHSLCETKVMQHDVTSIKKTTLSESKSMRAGQGVGVFEVAPILQPFFSPSLTPPWGLD